MVQPTSTAEYVYQGLKRMVIHGELAPGSRIVQRELAEKFGSSNIPIIEAIRRLEQEGLLVSRPNAGAQVPIWTEEDLQGAYLTREVLEGLASRLFVQKADEGQKERLQALNQEFHRMVERQDPEGWLEADLALHLHIVHSSRSKPLIRSVENSFFIVATISTTHRLFNGGGKVEPPPADSHDVLVASLLGGDSEAAEKTGRAHVHEAYERLKIRILLRDEGHVPPKGVSEGQGY